MIGAATPLKETVVPASSVPNASLLADASYRGDDPVCGNLPHPGIVEVGDEKIPCAIHCHAIRIRQLCIRSGPTVPGKTKTWIGSSHSGDDPARGNPPHSVIEIF